MGALKLTYRPEEHTPNLRVVYKSDCLNQREPGTTDDKNLRLHYSVFGSIMPGRNFSSNSYRFGFNGKESDSEWNGVTGAMYDYGFRIYDPRIGKFLSVDPLTMYYPAWTPYAFAMNRVIDGIDIDGLEWSKATDDAGNVTYTITLKVQNSAGVKNEVKEQYLNQIKQGIESTIKGTSNDGKSYSTNVVFDDKSAISDGDFYVDLVDDVTTTKDGKTISTGDVGYVDNIGDTKSNRVQILVHEEMTDEWISSTGAHEIGHTGGLWHPDNEKKVDSYGNPVGDDNFMWQGDKGSSITNSQLSTIDKTVTSGYEKPPFPTNRAESIPAKVIEIEQKEPQLKTR